LLKLDGLDGQERRHVRLVVLNLGDERLRLPTLEEKLDSLLGLSADTPKKSTFT
jgi:hypothetical protein